MSLRPRLNLFNAPNGSVQEMERQQMRNTESQNKYSGALIDWKVRYITKLALRKGYQGSDLDDVLQELVIMLQSFEYNSENANLASERTLLTQWVNRKLANMRRKENRAHNRDERVAKMRCIAVPPKPLNLKLDVKKAVRALSNFDQTVCDLLGRGFKKREIVQRLKCTPGALEFAIEKIRLSFEERGLDEWIRPR